MERSVVFLLLAAMLLVAQPAKSQSDDFGMWYELGVEKKLSKKWSLGLEGELRTRNNSKTTDRWAAGLSAEYKIVKGLKASVSYVFLNNNNEEKLTFKSDGYTPKKWTPGYWGTRHRFNVSLTGSADWKRFSFSLRERWQYTYRPEAADKRYKFVYNDDDELTGYNMEAVKGKGKHVLRSRLQIGYDIPMCKLDPFVNVEMFNAKGGIQKMRYQAGIDYKIKKQHVLSLTYRYQRINDDDDTDPEVNSHLVGLSYKFKF